MQKTALSVACAILLTLCAKAGTPGAAPSPTGTSERIIAGQVFYSPAANLPEFERELIDMKAQGINTVIFRVFGNPGDRVYGFANPRSEAGVYFHTAHSPVIDDILGAVTFLAHSHGLRLYAWMTTRSAVYGQSPELFDSRFDLSTRKYERIPKLDLFDPAAVAHLIGLYRDLARYPVDGILIQDDFVMRHMEGAGPDARRAYMEEFKGPLDPEMMYSDLALKSNGRVARITYTASFWGWAEFKNRRLIEVGTALLGEIKAANPGAVTCINTYYEMYRNPRNSLAWLAHNHALASRFDCVSVMAYHRQMIEELGIGPAGIRKTIQEITREAVSAFGAKAVIIKSQTIDWNDRSPVPTAEVQGMYDAIRAASPGVGVAFAPWEGGIRLRLHDSADGSSALALQGEGHRPPVD